MASTALIDLALNRMRGIVRANEETAKELTTIRRRLGYDHGLGAVLRDGEVATSANHGLGTQLDSMEETLNDIYMGLHNLGAMGP